MRFNPKADISTGRVSDAGGGGGGGGGGQMRLPIPGGTRAGGGIGGILILILFVVLTQCTGPRVVGRWRHQHAGRGTEASRMASTAGTSATPTARPGPTPTPTRTAPAWPWRTRSRSTGRDAARPGRHRLHPGHHRDLRRRGRRPDAARPRRRSGPFYCPPDQQIYLDTTFFADVLEGQLGGQGGDFVEPYVLGHEYGHHIQNLMGTMGQVRTQQGADSDAVRLELQADCYAGMWTKRRQRRRRHR